MYAHIENEAAYESAIRRNIRNNAEKTFHRTYSDSGDIIGFLMENQWSEFCKSLFDSFSQYGKLTEKQVNSIRSMMEKQAARKAAKQAEKAAKQEEQAEKSGFIGEVKSRQDFTFTVKKVITMDGFYGISYLFICEDSAGNCIIYKGTSNLADEGETVTVKATIKEHSLYNGVKQTIISRPKMI